MRLDFPAAVGFLGIFYILLTHEEDLIEYCQSKASWGPWRCPGSFGKCSEKLAKRYKCLEGDCVQGSQCTSLPGFTESKDCKTVLKSGACRPYWSSWTSWSACTATCGVSERSRYRPCIGAYIVPEGEGISALKGSCADPARAAEGMERRDCPLLRICPRIAGGWGEWGAFSTCDAVCGKGNQRRIRLCNRPPPSGGGVPCQGIDTQVIECDTGVPCSVDGGWCSWSTTVVKCSAPCGDSGMGLRTRTCTCPPPAQGGKQCPVPPGNKEAARLALSRLQDAASSGGENQANDVPMPSAADIAAIADGSGKWDACNRKFCPYLKELTDYEVNLTTMDLRLQRPEAAWMWSGGLPAGRTDTVGLHCPPERKSRVEVFDKRFRFPRSRAFWTRSVPRNEYQAHDTVPEPLRDSARLQVTGDRLIIRSLGEQDEGVYRFGYMYEPEVFATICFFAVYLSDKVVVVENGQPFELNCNSLGLWPIIQQTPEDRWSTYWTYKPDAEAQAHGSKSVDKLWPATLKPPILDQDDAESENRTASDGTMVLTLFDTEKRRFDVAKYQLRGHYQCIVSSHPNKMGQRKFITSMIQLIVTTPPTIHSKFLKWLRDHWHLIIFLFIVLAILSLLYMVLIKIRARRVASLRAWEAEEEARREAKLIGAGEIKMKTN